MKLVDLKVAYAEAARDPVWVAEQAEVSALWDCTCGDGLEGPRTDEKALAVSGEGSGAEVAQRGTGRAYETAFRDHVAATVEHTKREVAQYFGGKPVSTP